jgi:hypothetical protein
VGAGRENGGAHGIFLYSREGIGICGDQNMCL